MSKRKLRSKTAIMIVLMAIMGLIAIAVFAVSTINSQRIRERIDSHYAAFDVEMPPWLYLSDKRYNDRSLWDDSPGVKENWTYDYLPVAKEITSSEMRDILTKSLNSAGYSVDTQPYPDPAQGYITLYATGKYLNLVIDISNYPAIDGSPGLTSAVQGVGVQAYE